jgi:class 3 adenylate cyclase/predicted ATPase
MAEFTPTISVKAEAERRLATIVFADIVGYTERAEAMDPEEIHTLLDHIFSQFEKIIKDKGGYVDRYIGDALIAVFGVPKAGENDPEQAVGVALLIREELEKLSVGLKQKLSIRIGINTGEVLWGSVGSAGATVWGDSVNVAQRLQTSAAINSIVVSEATKQQLKEHFRLNQLPALKLKGKEQFIQAYEVIGVEKVRLPPVTPFIGRQPEVEFLKTSLKEVINNKKISLVLLSGEVGVGKSRLLSEFTNFLKTTSEEYRIFTERCLPHAQLPYDPLAEIIRHYFDLTNLSLNEASTRLAKETKRLLPDDSLAHHFLGFFLGIKYPDSPLTELTPEAAHISAFNTLKKVLEHASQEVNAMIFAIEDLQWADIGTKDFINYLNVTSFNAPLLIVVTTRIQENIMEYIGNIRDHARNSNARWKVIELLPFTKELTVQFVNVMFKDSRVSARFTEELWIKTGGNPLFMEELIRALSEGRGLPLKEKETWNLPENIWQIIESWIDRLPELEKKVLKVASVFGRIFWESGLSQCLQQPVRETLLQLEAKGFISRDLETLFHNDYQYTFRHELIRDVTYRMFLKRERSHFHRIVLDFLQAKQKNNELSEELYLKLGGYHAEESSEFGIAADLYEGYGDYENNRYMLEESLWVYRKAQEVISKSELKDIALRKARLIEKEAHIYYNLSRYKQAIEKYEQLNNEPPHWSWRVKGLLGIAEIYEKQADYESAFRYAKEATEIAFHGKNSRLLGSALNLVALSFIGKGLYSSASKLAGQLQNTFKQALTEETLSPIEVTNIKKELATSVSNIGLIQWYQGEYEAALVSYEETLKIMQEINNRYGIAASYINIGNTRRDQGNYQSAIDYYQKSLLTSEKVGSRRGMAVALLNIGAIHHDLGDYQQAQEYFSRSLTLSREIAAHHEETVALTSLGNLYHDQGEYSRALNTHLESLPLKRKLAEKSELVITLLNIATLFFERGEDNETLPLIAEAEKITKEVKAKMEFIISLNAFGRMLVYFALMGGLSNLPKNTLFAKAREYVQEALRLAKLLNLRRQILEALTSLSLITIQEAISPEELSKKESREILFHQAHDSLKEGESILPFITHKESHIHHYFAYTRYYIELINRLSKKARSDETSQKEIKDALQKVVKIATQGLNLTQELGLKRLQPEALYLYVHALALSGEESKAADYYANCRQLAEMMGLKPFLRITGRMPV